MKNTEPRLVSALGLCCAAGVFLCLAAGIARADLIAHYTFDDGEPWDEVSGLDGFTEGDAVATSVGGGVGGTGRAFRFSGLGHVRAPININPDVLPELTVTMWVKPDPTIASTPGLYKTFGHDDGGYDRVFGLDNRFGEYRWCAFTGSNVGPGTGTPVTADWTFIAAVWGPDENDVPTIRFHAGENYSVAEVNVTFSFHPGVAIGSLRPDNFAEGFRGLIDEVKFFDEALSVEEVNEVRLETTIPDTLAPDVITSAAANLRPNTATLRGAVNPNGEMTTAWFEYGPTTAYGNQTANMVLGEGRISQNVQAALTGLTEFATVHYRLVAESSVGRTNGDDMSFIVSSATEPIAHYTFDGSDAVDDTGNGFDGTPEGDALISFEGFGVGDEGYAYEFFGAGHVIIPVDINPATRPDLTVTMWVKTNDLVPISPGLYKAFGHDDGGYDRVFGLDNRGGAFRWAAFTGGFGGGITPDTGTTVTSEWTFLAAVWQTAENGSATLRFHANGNTIEQQVTNTASVFRTAAIGSLRPDNFFEGFQGLIDEVRIYGAALSIDQVEDLRAEYAPLEPGAPEVEALSAIDVAPGKATLRARVVPNGSPTTVHFEYGTTTAYGSVTADVEIGDSYASIPVEVTLDGLELETRYHFRAVAENSLGTTEGEDVSFFVPNAEFLLLHYDFEEHEPLDLSGNDHHGTVEGDAFPTGPGLDDSEGAFEFLGAGHIVVPLDVNPSVRPNLTVTMWVKTIDLLPGIPGLYKTFGHDDGGYDRVFGLDNRDGPYRWAAFTGGISGGITDDTGIPVSSEWTFLAAVWETAEDGSATIRFHANDSFIEEPVANTESSLTTFAIGSIRPDNFTEGFQGLIDEVRVYGRSLSVEEIDAIREGEDPPPVGARFIRGDADASGSLNLTDGIRILNYLFVGNAEVLCLDSADSDDSGNVNLSDGIYILNYLFSDGSAPPSPHPNCGTDPTEDGVTCTTQPACAF